MPILKHQSSAWCLGPLLLNTSLVAASATAQTARQLLGAAAVVPIENEPPVKIFVDPPLAEPLARGLVVIQYRAENLHIVPVFGPAALAISPRVGHAHVIVDDEPWVWADASGEPVILNGLSPGPHKVTIQLETANHQLLDQGAVQFTVPAAPAAHPSTEPQKTVETSGDEPPPTLVIDSPRSEPLSRGVVFLPYRAEHLQLVSVYGPAAAAVSPRIGQLHVSVDDATWHWVEASGNPIILQHLPPGSHQVHILMVNANHQPIGAPTTVKVTVPATKAPSHR
jgi:hypothetical protein